MEIELLNKLSNLTFASYINQSLNMVVVHFFNKDEVKNDIVVYLKPNMHWDVREIIDESSELDTLAPQFFGEDVTITHELIDMFAPGSKFDNFIRISINKMAQAEEIMTVDDRILEILENNTYDK